MIANTLDRNIQIRGPEYRCPDRHIPIININLAMSSAIHNKMIAEIKNWVEPKIRPNTTPSMYAAPVTPKPKAQKLIPNEYPPRMNLDIKLIFSACVDSIYFTSRLKIGCVWQQTPKLGLIQSSSSAQ